MPRLYERLEPLGLIPPQDLRLAWASPASRGDGVELMFQHLIRAPRPASRQQMLRLREALMTQTKRPRTWHSGYCRLPRIIMDNWADSFGEAPGQASAAQGHVMTLNQELRCR